MFAVQGLGYLAFDGGLHWNTAELGQSTVTLQTLTLTILLVVLLVPFQAAAEEYVFRGFLMQTIGSWIPVRAVGAVVAVVVSTVLFAVLHVPNGYNVWGILDVGSFGLVAAVIVLRTGGARGDGPPARTQQHHDLRAAGAGMVEGGPHRRGGRRARGRASS
ncbi:CPBP family intramembrane glutamic endopeptidase [Curtobacterium sp. MCPF17_052]|uniref:CPBP family intramembrane glutamic endopeptidase n=1 Tax=Curtobacterium sp. MCPF17_052 TaxID=2175655 RepID=UPI0024DFDD0D|nr:CPBP family intramembrane glutamic endopeptidase [Curtobacterium sp. MCPF17_052]WIB13968.1 lysostaphin resistance A-like protein [Curtobacterium sp. MCPF17_052]